MAHAPASQVWPAQLKPPQAYADAAYDMMRGLRQATLTLRSSHAAVMQHALSQDGRRCTDASAGTAVSKPWRRRSQSTVTPELERESFDGTANTVREGLFVIRRGEWYISTPPPTRRMQP